MATNKTPLIKSKDSEEDKDDKNDHPVKFRLFYLLFDGGCQTFTPYFTMMLRQRGFTPELIGILRTAINFSRFLGRPFTTFLADRFQLRKTFLILSLVGWIIGYGGIVYVSPQIQESCSDVVNTSEVSYTLNSTAADVNFTDVRTYNMGTNESSQTANLEVLNWLYNSSNIVTIFGIYMAFAIVSGIFQSVTLSLVGAEALNSLRKNKYKFGWQKAFGGIGSVVG